MTSSNPHSSGDGSRPTTDGGVDNLGPAKAFQPGSEGNRPVREKLPGRCADNAQARSDDSAPLGLRDDAESTPNTEPPSVARENNEEGR